MAAALLLPLGQGEVPHHQNHAQNLLEYAKIHPPRSFWLSLWSKLVSHETFAVKVIFLLQASFWSFLFAKENPRLQNNEQNARKEAWFYIHATLPPRGLQKVSNSQKIQQELENLWGKHATKAPTHMLYHHLTQVEQFSLCIKQKLSFSNKK